MYLGATILLPKGYDEHPDERYPVIYLQSHFNQDITFGFNPTLVSGRSVQRVIYSLLTVA